MTWTSGKDILDSSAVTLGCPAKQSGSSGKRRSKAEMAFENRLDEILKMFDLFNVPGAWFPLLDTWEAWDVLQVN